MPYATETGLERILARIAQPHNQERVRSYLEEARANGKKLSSVTCWAGHLRQWAEALGERPFESAVKQDVIRFVNQAEVDRLWMNGPTRTERRVKVSAATMNLRKVVIRAFMRWLRGGGPRDPYPPEVAWLKLVRNHEDDNMPVESVLKREELHAMIEAQDHFQHRAMIAVLYDSGLRASEFCSLRLRDVSIDEYGAVLSLPKGALGLKTGARRVRIIHSTPYLIAWTNAHPWRDKPDKPLWISLSHRNRGAAYTANSLYTFVQKVAKRASLDRDVWPHLFRHSRATEAAREGWPESEMRHFFGWSKDSDMPSRYVHLSGKDYEENMLRRAGKLNGQTVTLPALLPRICVCTHENPASADFCERAGCGKPLTVSAASRRPLGLDAVLAEAIDADTEAGKLLAAVVMRKVQEVLNGKSATKAGPEGQSPHRVAQAHPPPEGRTA